jgi:hypothetical protein
MSIRTRGKSSGGGAMVKRKFRAKGAKNAKLPCRGRGSRGFKGDRGGRGSRGHGHPSSLFLPSISRCFSRLLCALCVLCATLSASAFFHQASRPPRRSVAFCGSAWSIPRPPRRQEDRGRQLDCKEFSQNLPSSFTAWMGITGRRFELHRKVLGRVHGSDCVLQFPWKSCKTSPVSRIDATTAEAVRWTDASPREHRARIRTPSPDDQRTRLFPK